MTTAATPPEPAADDRVVTIAVLAESQCRRVFGYVHRARRPVARGEVAADSAVSVELAAFHLDKLVEAGLLRPRYETSAGTGNRKVGRRPKVYEPTGVHLRVSIPERRPDVIAEILIDAVITEQGEESARAAAGRTARRHGHDIGSAERVRIRPGRLGPERSVSAVEPVLERIRVRTRPARRRPRCACSTARSTGRPPAPPNWLELCTGNTTNIPPPPARRPMRTAARRRGARTRDALCRYRENQWPSDDTPAHDAPRSGQGC